jgi:DNA-binding transcriptional regulator YiaG
MYQPTKKKRWTKYEVRALRQHLNLTQARLAEELGTRQQTISEWENGMYRPRGASATLLSIIAERCGFTYEAGRMDDAHNRLPTASNPDD